MNIQGAVNNFNEIETIIYNNNFEFVGLSETHLISEDSDKIIQINNYDIIRADSISHFTGGVLFYIKKNWKYEVKNKIAIGMNLWYVIIKLYKTKFKIYLVVLYKSPNRSYTLNNFIENFNTLIEFLNDVNDDVVLMGDFNINLLEDSLDKRKINQIINDAGLKQIIREPTRITPNSRTLIDYILTNNTKKISAEISSSCKVSDHESICIKINQKHNSTDRTKVIKWFKYNKQNFRNSILHSPLLTTFYVPLNEKASNFNKNLKYIVNSFTVPRKITENGNQWFSNELRLMKISKENQYRAAAWINSTGEWEKYRQVRNLYKNQINKTKNQFLINQIQHARDQKSMWNIIKYKVLKSNNTNEIKEIIFNNVQVEDELQIANKFNEYFIKSIIEIRESIPDINHPNSNITYNEQHFKFENISMSELKAILKSMNKKRDINLISANLLLDNLDLIGNNLLEIINESLSNGTYPESWKESIVIPIPKVNNTKLCNEFRPINMIPTEAKVLEKIVNNQLKKFLEINGLITESQSGFREKHNCETLLNLTLNNWKITSYNKKIIIAVFLDFQRAFETVDREELLKKMQKYGIRDIEYRWFSSYLQNRTQRTKINSTISSAQNVTIGVPQGSVLGVLLFLLYINDIEKAVDFATIALFADDALVYVTGDSIDECSSKINSDLEKLNNWCKINKVKLNKTKTKAMIINGRLNGDIIIDNYKLEVVNELKYLGFIIDNKLKFKNHEDYMCKKIGKKLNYFYRIRNKLSTSAAINVYNTMVKPHFEYCSTLMAFSNNDTLERLQKLQNRGMRIILKCGRYTQINRMLASLKWLNIKQRFKLNVLVFVFKMKNKLLPNYLSSSLIYVQDVQHYHLRNIFNFRLNFFRSEAPKKTVLYKGLEMYNELPNEIKTISSISKFKKKIIEFLKTS